MRTTKSYFMTAAKFVVYTKIGRWLPWSEFVDDGRNKIVAMTTRV
jgi:hypothetical protein